jgi:hypothetical protein
MKPMKQIFVSHTKKDEKFCDKFDTVCARVGVKAFRSEFEDLSTPSWKTIKIAMNNSSALFFLVGGKLVESQNASDPEWKYTQNWIAYEIGLACQLGIDVWAICDDVLINFPMPYINNYLTVSLVHDKTFKYLKSILEEYRDGGGFPYKSTTGTGTHCPYQDCKMGFNLHVKLNRGSKIRCPQCLRDMVFTGGYTPKHL